MRIFVIKNDEMPGEAGLAYLLYLEEARTFYIEIPDETNPWDLPPLLSSLVSRGERSVDRFWSRRFVQYRIIPPDRQNIGQILRDNGLKEYDEFALLMLSMGRCEQDACYLEEIEEGALPECIKERWKGRIAEVLPLSSPKLLLFYTDGQTKLVDVQGKGNRACEPYLLSQERFERMEVQPGGFGIQWSEKALISYRELGLGREIPFSFRDLQRYLDCRLVSAAEAGRLLECSRQNIDDLMRRDKLHPMRTDAKNKLFSRAEVMSRRKEVL